MKLYLVFFQIILISFILQAQQKVTLKEVCKLEKVLNESSGLVIANGNIWTHNDSWGEPVLYAIDESCQIKTILYVSGQNKDWEELAKDDAGNIYIGDFGNNDNKRHDLKIYKIPSPANLKDNIAKPEIIEFKYPDQNRFPPAPSNMQFDMEAMIWFNGSLYLFSKNNTEPFTGYTKLYRLPDAPGKYTAELVDSIFLGAEPKISHWVTGADISPDKKKLVLLSHDKIWLFTCFEGDNFFSGKKETIIFPTFTQKEAICFINDHELYLTDEVIFKTGGKLYHLNLKEVKIEDCK